jgi:hypothetical protein
VFMSPLFAEGLVKSCVVGRDEMTPLKYFQGLLLCRRFFWKQKERAGTHVHCQRAATRPLDEVST